MNMLYMLVGVPGSGKTTWANMQSFSHNCVYISTDKYVEEYAEQHNKPFDEVYDEAMPYALRMMAYDVNTARENHKDIVWDQTSTTVVKRARKFNMLPDYYTIAVVLETPVYSTLLHRIHSRPGRNTPVRVVDAMIKEFEMPTREEGFHEIWRIANCKEHTMKR